MTAPLTIGILWWSGRTWQAVIQEALRRWHTIVTLVRSPQNILQKNISIIQGDAKKSYDIENILDKVTVLVDTVSVPFFHKHPTTLFSHVAEAICEAWEKYTHTLQQVIIMSSAWTHHGRSLPRPANWWYELFLGDVANDKEHAEAIYAASSVHRTYIKAPLLTNWKRESYTTGLFSEYSPSLLDSISRATVASCIVDIAEKKIFLNEKITPRSS